jgi:uncharacterized protein YgiM (DUF1202 family)
MPRMPVVFSALMIAVLAVSAGFGKESFPYKAYVTEEGTELRSGPGDDFYPTDKMPKGEMVEVYRRDADGWCAIRPPAGSFSWVSGRVLRFEDGNAATVKEDDVASRVGSSLSSVRDVIQVRMHKGEAVEILDSNESAGGQSQSWYKIAPPSGEFRWISEKFISKEAPRDDSRVAGSANANSQRESDARAADGIEKMPSQQFQAELDRIDLELSMMVVEDPSAWSFDAMRIRGETLLDRAGDAADRGKARLLLNRIARFDDIKQRYDSVTAMREQNAKSNRFLAGLQKTMETAAAKVDPDGQFDGVGQLQMVFSPKVGSPRFALVDEAGNVRYYVTPAPGVNLQNYVGRQVGITGTRGYMPEQKAQHITARHISSLETQMR